jgi:hypothetical protein
MATTAPPRKRAAAKKVKSIVSPEQVLAVADDVSSNERARCA